jgi:hypothetical protein
MPNDLHVWERHAPRPGSANRRRRGKTLYRYFRGVKWSNDRQNRCRNIDIICYQGVFRLVISLSRWWRHR